MKRSNAIIENTDSDFHFVNKLEHIAKVIEDFDKNIPKYFSKIGGENGLSEMSVARLFIKGIERFYEKEKEKYQSFFSEESMDEYAEDDPKSFKRDMRNECPVIRKSMNSRITSMKEWQQKYSGCSPRDLLDVFHNILDFALECSENYKASEYDTRSSFVDFQHLNCVSDEYQLKKGFAVPGVIGTGISSTVLFYMYPHIFSRAVRRTFYGMYFLSDSKSYDLKSNTNEFIMIDDTKEYKTQRGSEISLSMEHNYWYGYDLFMYYSYFIYKKIKTLSKKYNFRFSDRNRYIYVYTFLDHVCKQHEESITEMMGGDVDYR